MGRRSMRMMRLGWLLVSHLYWSLYWNRERGRGWV